MPPISAPSTRKWTSDRTMNGTSQKVKPKWVRMASGMAWRVTAAKRPDISTRKITRTVPRSSGQRSC